MLRAQRNNKLLVRLLLALLVEHTHVRLTTVEGLRGLAQTARESIVRQRDTKNALQSVENAHLAASAGLGGDFDLVGRGHGGVGLGLFSVRLVAQLARFFERVRLARTIVMDLLVGCSSKSNGV